MGTCHVHHQLGSSSQLKTFDMDVLTTASAAPKCVIRAIKLFVADVARLIERLSHRSRAWLRYLDLSEEWASYLRRRSSSGSGSSMRRSHGVNRVLSNIEGLTFSWKCRTR
jgi:hypothetical protein